MPRTPDTIAKVLDGTFFALGIMTLLVCLTYGKLLITQVDPDFRLDPTRWIVTAGQECESGRLCLETGDRVLEIDGVTLQEYLSDRSQSVSWTGELITVRFLRHGQVFDLVLEPSGEDSWVRSLEDVLTLLVSLVFWSVATAAGLFMRPRDSRWALMILFGYGLGLWFAAGALSSTQLGFSVWVFHSASWLSLPLSTHLHLSLPSLLLRSSRRWILIPIYVGAGVGLWLDLTYRLPEGSFIIPVLLALGSSLILLTVRQFQKVSSRELQANRLMLFGMILGLGPWFLVVAMAIPIWFDEQATFARQSVILRASLLATVPLWPTTYLYAAAKHTLGEIEFRANRLFGFWSFLIYIIVLQFIILMIGLQSGVLRRNPAEFCLIMGVASAIIGKPLLKCCQKFFDRKILGLRHTPEEILGILAYNIPRLHEAQALPRLLHDTILPTLLIRQSAIYVFADSAPQPVDEFGVEPLTSQELAALPNLTHEDVDPMSAPQAGLPDWVHLALPLWTDGTLVGLWLVGRRDPDDYYTQGDVALLRRVGNQIGSLLRVQQEIAENRRLEEQLFQSQKLEAIGRLSAGVAHDFNNLLAVIHLNSEFMRPRIQSDGTALLHLESILSAGDRAKKLIRQLLAFSRHQRMEFRLEDVDDIVGDMKDMLNTLLTDRVRLEFRRTSGLPLVKVDRGRLEQAIVNLALNAGQSMPQGGPVEIWTDHVMTSPPESSETSAEGFVVLHIRDRGEGIPSQVQNRIFEPFFTTKPAGMGSGLGLSIVYGIVRQCGGQIAVDSKVDIGTTLSIWLPAVAPQAADEAPQCQIVPLATKDSTILLVEDESILRRALTEVLESEGYSVLTASDGRDALGLVATYEETIDLLLTDVQMPRMGGLALAEELYNQQPSVKIVFMSSFDRKNLQEIQSRLVGAEFLRKPFSISVLTKTVQQALRLAGDSNLAAATLKSTALADSIE